MMSRLALRLAVSAAAASVVMTAIEALRARHPRAVASAEPLTEPADEGTMAPPKLAVRAAAQAKPARTEEPRPPDPLAMAKIHGRMLSRTALHERVELKLDDGTRDYQPEIDKDGVFEMNLPPGSYALMATAGDEVAVAEVDGLATGEDREVVLTLGPGVAIEGRVEGCDGPCVDACVRAELPGTHLMAAMSSCDDNGEFALDGLPPGKTYDLVFQGEGRRRLTVHAMAAPRSDLLVTLEPAASLSGGFGIKPGQTCPMDTVEVLSKGGEEQLLTADFDHNCRFMVENLPDGDSVHLRAIGTGWHFEVDLPVPAHGDPPFLCLRPTCRAP